MNPIREVCLVALAGALGLLLAMGPALGAEPSAAALSRPPAGRLGPVSPDGRFVVQIGTARGRGYLALHDLDSDLIASVSAQDDAEHQAWWVADDRLLFARFAEKAEDSGWFWIDAGRELDRLRRRARRLDIDPQARNPIGRDVIVLREDRFPGDHKALYYRLLDADDARQAEVVDPLYDDAEALLFSLPDDSVGGRRLLRLKLREAVVSPVRAEHASITRWLTTPDGRPRLAWQRVDAARERILVRDGDEGGSWRPVREAPLDALRPLAWDEAGEQLLTASREHREHYAVFRFSPTTGELAGPLYADPNYDVTEVVTALDGKPLFIEYYAERLRRIYFDQARGELQSEIDAVLPGRENRILSSDRQRRVHVVGSYSDRQPIQYYLLDEGRGVLRLMLRSRPWLDTDDMAHTRATKVPGNDDQQALPALVTRPGVEGTGPWPTVILLHDRPGSERFRWGFDPFTQGLAAQGLAVVAIDHAGTSGLGRTVAQREDWYARTAGDAKRAAQWAIAQGIAAQGSLCVLGREAGGLAALRAIAETEENLTCAVALDPTPVSEAGDWRPAGDEAPCAPAMVLSSDAASSALGKAIGRQWCRGDAQSSPLTTEALEPGTAERRRRRELERAAAFLREQLEPSGQSD